MFVITDLRAVYVEFEDTESGKRVLRELKTGVTVRELLRELNDGASSMTLTGESASADTSSASADTSSASADTSVIQMKGRKRSPEETRPSSPAAESGADSTFQPGADDIEMAKPSRLDLLWHPTGSQPGEEVVQAPFANGWYVRQQQKGNPRKWELGFDPRGKAKPEGISIARYRGGKHGPLVSEAYAHALSRLEVAARDNDAARAVAELRNRWSAVPEELEYQGQRFVRSPGRDRREERTAVLFYRAKGPATAESLHTHARLVVVRVTPTTRTNGRKMLDVRVFIYDGHRLLVAEGDVALADSETGLKTFSSDLETIVAPAETLALAWKENSDGSESAVYQGHSIVVYGGGDGHDAIARIGSYPLDCAKYETVKARASRRAERHLSRNAASAKATKTAKTPSKSVKAPSKSAKAPDTAFRVYALPASPMSDQDEARLVAAIPGAKVVDSIPGWRIDRRALSFEFDGGADHGEFFDRMFLVGLSENDWLAIVVGRDEKQAYTAQYSVAKGSGVATIDQQPWGAVSHSNQWPAYGVYRLGTKSSASKTATAKSSAAKKSLDAKQESAPSKAPNKTETTKTSNSKPKKPFEKRRGFATDRKKLEKALRDEPRTLRNVDFDPSVKLEKSEREDYIKAVLRSLVSDNIVEEVGTEDGESLYKSKRKSRGKKESKKTATTETRRQNVESATDTDTEGDTDTEEDSGNDAFLDDFRASVKDVLKDPEIQKLLDAG